MLAEYERLYAEATALHGDSALLLLQVGSFWELYWEPGSRGERSASAARDVLGIALMKQKSGSDVCATGFPMVAEAKMAAKLLDEGWTVCFGEQSSSAVMGKVTRALGRCISPGMRVDVDTDAGNYACCLHYSGDRVGAALIDVATGCCIVVQADCNAGVAPVLSSRNVTAVVLHGTSESQVSDALPDERVPVLDRRPSAPLGDAMADALLGDAFGGGPCRMADDLLLASRPLALHALVRLLDWMGSLSSLFGRHLPRPTVVDPAGVVSFSSAALRQLGVPDLERMLNCASTPPGRRRFRHVLYSPHACASDAAAAHDVIQSVVSAGEADNDSVRAALALVGDIQRWGRRCLQLGVGVSEARQLVAALEAVVTVTGMSQYLPGGAAAGKCAGTWLGALSEYDPDDPTLFPGDADVEAAAGTADAASGAMSAIERSVHPDARLDAVGGGHRIKVSTRRLAAVDAVVRARFAEVRAGAYTFLTCAALDATSAADREARDALNDAQEAAWRRLLGRVSADDIARVVEFVTAVDVAHACARNAFRLGHVRPVMRAGGEATFDARQLGNPVAERAMERYSKERYVRNDVRIDDGDSRHVLLYSVNGCGKSCLLRSVGLAIVMAQAGMFVAAEALDLAPFARLDTRILTPDDVHRGHSSYTAELLEVREALRAAGPRSLVLADEMYCSTEWRSGTAMLGTTIAHLAAGGSKSLVTTHFHELTELAALRAVPGLQVMHMSVTTRPGVGVVYDRSLRPGQCGANYGIAVAAAYGFGAAFVRDANVAREELARERPHKSRWNARVIVGKCESCGKQAVETHHIKQRSEAVSGRHGHVSQNHPSNLATLCEACHQAAHQPGAAVHRVKTLTGYDVSIN